MRQILFFCSSVIFAALFFTASHACYAAEGLVQAADRIPIQQPKSSGEWKGSDLSVKYDYSVNNGQMDLSGRIEFAYSMTMGYSELRDLHLSVVFADQNGSVVGNAPLVIKTSLRPSDFHDRIAVPPGAKIMAFKYDGVAIGSTGRNPTSFWHDPVQ